MKKISSRSVEVAERIRDRVPFQTYGSVCGTTETWHGSGRLSGADQEAWHRDVNTITYVVYSYVTPIAWHSSVHGWHRVSQKFSVTTSHHQGRLYLIDTCICHADHPSTECPEHPTCQGVHA